MTTIDEWRATMTDRRVRHLPVVEDRSVAVLAGADGL
jgi:hypothetical protein